MNGFPFILFAVKLTASSCVCVSSGSWPDRPAGRLLQNPKCRFLREKGRLFFLTGSSSDGVATSAAVAKATFPRLKSPSELWARVLSPAWMCRAQLN